MNPFLEILGTAERKVDPALLTHYPEPKILELSEGVFTHAKRFREQIMKSERVQVIRFVSEKPMEAWEEFAIMTGRHRAGREAMERTDKWEVYGAKSIGFASGSVINYGSENKYPEEALKAVGSSFWAGCFGSSNLKTK